MADLTLYPMRVDNTWHFADGTVLPVVSGGDGAADAPAGGGGDPYLTADPFAALDGGAGAGAAEPPAAAAPDAAAGDGTPAADGGVGAAAGTAEPTEGQPVPWEDHLKLRHENAKYRERWKGYEDAFAGFDEDTSGALLHFANLLKTDPGAAVEWMEQQVELARDGGGGNEAPAGGAGAGEQPLTRAEVEQLLAERDHRAGAEAAQRQIDDQARSLGYKPDARDEVEGRKYADLLFLAVNVTGGDLAKADEMRKADEQRTIDAYVARQRAAANGTVAPVLGTGAHGAHPAPPKDWKEADAAAMAILRAGQ